jgi:poly-gamma-glutamate capsule biosynthesis protein CapA/YwtB (metallophosphatase superfamily)
VVLLAGGDVAFARMQGRMLRRDPHHAFFTRLEPWFRAAQLRFVNLESQLAERSPAEEDAAPPMVFVGRPVGALHLARLGVDIVSTANNHAWDFGRGALFETLEHLDRAGVKHVGTGKTRDEAEAPVTIERGGQRFVFLAVTSIWNQGELRSHPAREHVADADIARLAERVRSLRAANPAARIVVSHHGGEEYSLAPTTLSRALGRAALDAGADVVLGHHPHVLQGVEQRADGLVFHSLGNLLMRMHSHHPETELGVLARVTFAARERAAAEAELCPFRVFGTDLIPLRGDAAEPARFAQFRALFERARRRVDGLALSEPSSDGCFRLVRPGVGTHPRTGSP